MARQLLEYFEAYLRASENLAIFANMRGVLPRSDRRADLQPANHRRAAGPYHLARGGSREDPNWYAVNVIVPRASIFQAVNELRAIGGSGVVVMPVTYIFEEEPPRYMAMLQALQGGVSYQFTACS